MSWQLTFRGRERSGFSGTIDQREGRPPLEGLAGSVSARALVRQFDEPHHAPAPNGEMERLRPLMLSWTAAALLLMSLGCHKAPAGGSAGPEPGDDGPPVA